MNIIANEQLKILKKRLSSDELNPYKVHYMRPQDINNFLKSAAMAYEDYPLFNYLVGKDSKAEPIKQILRASVKSSKTKIIGISAGENASALALFIKPNYKGTPAFPFLFYGGIKLICKYSLGMVFRLLNYEKYAMHMKEKYSNDNCWYLYSLTVHPDYQHKGLATIALKPMLDFFDTTGQSCYLETNKLCNVPMSEHYGFKLMETGKIPGTDVVHYAMRREPRINSDEKIK